LGTVEIFPVWGLSVALLEILSKELDVLISDNPACNFSRTAKQNVKKQRRHIATRIALLRKFLAE